MSRKITIIYISVFSFLVCFLLIGYAALTDSLTLTSDISGEAQKNIFITDITVEENEISKVNINSFYGQVLYQNIKLAASNETDDSDETYYIVKLYNNSNDKWFYDGHSFSNMLPSGVKVTIEELQTYNDSTIASTNIISSIIDPYGYDYIKITYKNDSSSDVTITQNLGFNYIKLDKQIKVVFEYEGVEYIKYAEYISDREYEDVTFNQISIDLSNESLDRVARCNNGAVLSVKSNYIKISNITNYSRNDVGELAVYCKIFESLTSAINSNEDAFENDNTPNNFLVLKNIPIGIEPTDNNAIILADRDYSVNLNGKSVFHNNTIQNYGKLKLYSTIAGGRLHKKFNSNTDMVDYTDTYNVKIVKDGNMLEHYGSDIDNSYLIIDNVILELIDNNGGFNKLVKDVLDQNYAFAYYYEFPAIVAALDGYVKITNSDFTTNNGYCVHKKSQYAGNYNERLNNPTNPESKVIIESSNLLSIYNNCVRFSDGNGIISIVDTKLQSSMEFSNLPYEDTSNSLFGDYKNDPIFVGEHFLEGLNNSTVRKQFNEFYEDATTNIKVFVTGGEIYCNNTNHVNHFYSANKLNARLYYTKSTKFYTLQSDNLIYEDKAYADTWDTSFTYSTSMINGNGASYEELFNTDGTLNRNHYLNNDGWYYIKNTITDLTGEDSKLKSDNNVNYMNDEYIQNAEYEYLMHNDEKVRVGDSFEMINFNNPGYCVIENKDYDNTSNFFSPLESISDYKSMSDYMGFEYEYTFIASCDKNYYNIVSLGNLNEVFHIENPAKLTINGEKVDIPYANNVGIKYIDTSLTTLQYPVQIDKKEQRFTLMKYDYPDREGETYPYVFVSKYNSVISYFIAKVAEDENGNAVWNQDGTPKWNTEIKFADKYFVRDGFESITNPSFLDKTKPYEYPYAYYLLSNMSSPTYKRNGWYLWQDETPRSNNKIWNNEYYTNLMYLGYKNQITNGDNTIDDNTKIYVSSQAKVTSYGVVLTSNHANNETNTSDNWGYIRFNSQQRIIGVRVVFAKTNTSTNLNAPKKAVLKIRTYDKKGARLDCPILYSNLEFGLESYEDEDEFGYKSIPYYVVIPKSEEGGTVTFTILFDLDKISTDIHTITFDPFDFGNQDNTMTIKTVTIISDVKDYLK